MTPLDAPRTTDARRASPNARFQARLEARARYERRLAGVACKPLFGVGSGRDVSLASSLQALAPLPAQSVSSAPLGCTTHLAPGRLPVLVVCC